MPQQSNIALLNAADKDEMVRALETFVSEDTKKAETVLLSVQFATYHEYAAQFRAVEHCRNTEAMVRRIIKKHTEG